MYGENMRGYSAIGLVAPKSEPNVGGALRAACCYGASLVVVQGHRFQKQITDTHKAWRHMPLIVGDIMASLPYDCVAVAVELYQGARDLRTYTHPERAMYIFGPEDGSIPEGIINKCRDVIQIPMRSCMNLAATVNVVLYDRLTKRG